MAKRWSNKEESLRRRELERLYIKQNRSIGEIAKILNLGQSTVYQRLLRLGITPARSRKLRFNNKRSDISIPKDYSKELSEFIGILLGDGHITPTQVTVTLGNKEENYTRHVARLISKLFNIKPKVMKRKGGYHIVYFGSTVVVRWLVSMGLAFNKVKNQVKVPPWVFANNDYMKGFLKGFFDTDGSVYKLRFGVQLAFTNRSLPILESLQHCLTSLGYSPSNISLFRTYLTRKNDVIRFFETIRPANARHQERFKELRWRSG